MNDLSAGRSEAGFAFGRVWVIQEVEDHAERLRKLAEKHLNAVQLGKTSMIVSPTHAEARIAANAVRQELRVAGLLERRKKYFRTLGESGLDSRPKKNRGSLRSRSDRRIASDDKGTERDGKREPKFLSGEQWRVKRKEAGSVVIERNGAEKRLPLSQGKNFSAYQTEKLALSLGDRVRITKNFVIRDMDGKSRCRNNDVHTVTAITEDGIGLSNGVSLRRGYWHLDQGLVVTSHAAQGKTVDQVLVSVPVQTFSQVNEAQGYVSFSRARPHVCVHDCCSLQRGGDATFRTRVRA